MGEPREELTIAQALRRIKDIKGRVAKHGLNAQACVTHLAESKPAYSFSAEWEKATTLVDEMIDLQTRVSIANAKTEIVWMGARRPLTWCVKRLAEIKGSIAWHESLVVRAQTETVDTAHEWVPGTTGRVRTETRYMCHLPEAARAERVEALQEAFNALNDLVERENHRTPV